MLPTFIEKYFTAICRFCLNGGICLYPYVNCACTSQWEGDRCDKGNRINLVEECKRDETRNMNISDM